MTIGTTSRERPINLHDWEVLGLIDGSITEIWRPVKKQPSDRHQSIGLCHYSPTGWAYQYSTGACSCRPVRHNFGRIGDRLWGRETFYADIREKYPHSINPAVIYAITPELAIEKMNPRVFACTTLDQKAISRYEAKKNLENHRFQRLVSKARMPRWASRFILEVTDWKCKQVQTLDEAEAINAGSRAIDAAIMLQVDSEGRVQFLPDSHELPGTAKGAFCCRWDQSYAACGLGFHTCPWAWGINVKRVEVEGGQTQDSVHRRRDTDRSQRLDL